MGIILLGPAITGVIALTFLLVARWTSNREPGIRNVTSFSMAAVASYAAGFTFDMVFSAVDGELPPANIVLPSITWSSIAVVSLVAAVSARGSRVARTLPFWLNAAVAFVAGFVQVRNVVIAGLLLVVSMLLWRHGTRRSQSAAEDINSPASQRAMHRLRVVYMWTIWARPVTNVGALASSAWLVFLTYSSTGAVTAFGWFVGLSLVYKFGGSPIFAVASSVLSFHFHVVGPWLPITSYVLAALLLYVDTDLHDLKQRVDPVQSSSIGDV